MKKITIIVALTAFTVGICFIILGSISVELMTGLGISAAQFGTLVMGFFLTGGIVQFFIGPLVDKVGYKPVAILGFIVTILGMFILAFASSFSILLIACILLGIGAMSLSTVANTLMPVILFEGKDPARASNFGNGFFALGYILTPLFIVFMLKTLSLGYSSALISIGILFLFILVFALTANFPQVSTGFKFSMVLTVIFEPAVLVAMLAVVCYISLEVSMGTWIKKLMEELYGGSANVNAAVNAGLVLSLFGIAVEINGRKTGRMRLAKIPNASSESLNNFINSNIEKGSVVISDGWTGYSDLSKIGFTHEVQNSLVKDEDEEILPNVH